jgi:hypothetical protein
MTLEIARMVWVTCARKIGGMRDEPARRESYASLNESGAGESSLMRTHGQIHAFFDEIDLPIRRRLQHLNSGECRDELR